MNFDVKGIVLKKIYYLEYQKYLEYIANFYF